MDSQTSPSTITFVKSTVTFQNVSNSITIEEPGSIYSIISEGYKKDSSPYFSGRLYRKQQDEYRKRLGAAGTPAQSRQGLHPFLLPVAGI